MANYTNPTIGQCVAWPHEELNADYKTGANIWREVTQEFADEMRDCVPPVYVAGVRGFMVGEAYDHDSAGRVVYCGFVKLCGRWFARNVAAADFAEAVDELKKVLP
jgi:hypothetical protein